MDKEITIHLHLAEGLVAEMETNPDAFDEAVATEVRAAVEWWLKVRDNQPASNQIALKEVDG